MKTLEELYGAMMAAFTEKTGMETSGSGDLAVRFYAVAAQLYSLYIQADWTARQCFPQTAEGEYLDRHAALRGVSRREAAQAQGTIRFSVDSALTTDLTIPAGTVCMTAGLVRFETTRDAVLTAGETWVEAAAQAVEPGTAGNVAAGSVLAMAVAPVGVSRCSNPQPFLGGMDQEGDMALRERVLETFKRLPNGANAAFYQQGALSFPQVVEASVIPRKRGVGTVDVVIATGAGLPDQALLNQVEAYFETRREIAVDVQVKAPVPKPVKVSVAVKAEEAYDAVAVRREVETALTSFFGGKRLAKDLLRAELGRVVFDVPGVANYSLTSPPADVAVGADELPRAESIEVTAL